MRHRSRKAAAYSIAMPTRHVLGKAALILLIIASLSLIITSRTSPETRNAISAPITDSAAPVLDILSRPTDSMSRFTGWIQGLANIYAQNSALRDANAKLMQWQHVALRLEAENAALRELVHYTANESLHYTTAKVISDRGGPFTRTATINAGSKLGIAVGQPVINSDGLVGRIIEVGEHSSHILLLTDINSRMPVMTEKSRERSIAAGSNDDELQMLYLPDNTKVQVGEKILTSGDGNTVPAGIAVGEIVREENGLFKVHPFANWFRLDYVSVIQPQPAK